MTTGTTRRPIGALVTAVLLATTVVGAGRPVLADATTDRLATEIAKGIVAGAGGKVAEKDAACMGKAIITKLGPSGVAKLAAAPTFEAAPRSTRLAVFTALKACPGPLGTMFAQGMLGSVKEMAPADATCIGNAVVRKLSAAQMLALAETSSDRATQVALFGALRACPDAVGPLVSQGLAGNGNIPLTAVESTCMGRSIMTGLSSAELYAVSTGDLGATLMGKVFTVLVPCGDVLPKLLAVGFERSEPTLSDLEGLCRARKLIAVIPPAELVAISSGTPTAAQKQKLQTEMTNIVAACKTAKK